MRRGNKVSGCWKNMFSLLLKVPKSFQPNEYVAFRGNILFHYGTYCNLLQHHNWPFYLNSHSWNWSTLIMPWECYWYTLSTCSGCILFQVWWPAKYAFWYYPICFDLSSNLRCLFMLPPSHKQDLFNLI